MEMDGRNVLFKVGCEGGTYIRKLCFDIGEILGVGAHMQELRRTRAGPFLETSAKKVTLHDVAYWFGEYEEKKDQSFLCKFIEPMEVALMQIPKIIVRDSAVDALCHGANLTAPGVLQVDTGIVKDSTVAVFTLKGRSGGVGEGSCFNSGNHGSKPWCSCCFFTCVDATGHLPEGLEDWWRQ